MRMAFATISLLLVAAPALAATSEPSSSAREWLALVDQQKYADAWKEGASVFRASIPEKGWEGKAAIYREAVGNLQRRDVEVVQLVSTLPNMPDGQYAVVRFHSTFSGKPESRETVNLVQEGDLWRVAGYTIK
jgi:hypothetical protein